MTLLTRAISKWQGGELSDPLMASTFLLCKAYERDSSLLARKSSKFVKITSPAIFPILETSVAMDCPRQLMELFIGQRLKGYSIRVSDALENWLRGHWQMKLLDSIPYPSQVFQMQCQGIRPVSMITDTNLWGLPIRDHDDELDFMVHDLEHAANFHKSVPWKEAQVAFFNDLGKIEHVIKPHLSNARFRQKYEYMIADMNSHVLHLILFLRASLLEYLDDREIYQGVLAKLAEAFAFDGYVKESFLHFERLPRYEASVALTEYYQNYPPKSPQTVHI